jgi:hypothetical protein
MLSLQVQELGLVDFIQMRDTFESLSVPTVSAEAGLCLCFYPTRYYCLDAVEQQDQTLE